MPERPAPSVRGRQLARELRRLREAAGMTGEAVAAHLGWSGAKISRIETARTSITISDLRSLLDFYGTRRSEAERLEGLARTSRERGWWDLYADALPLEYVTFIGLEAEAASLDCYNALLVHGLLQTEEYARTVINAAGLRIPPGDIDRRVQVRRLRQRRLSEADGTSLNVHAVLDEHVLRRQVGGPDVMRGQLLHLIEMAAKPNIVIQVLPYSAGAHAAMTGPFAILRFPHFSEPEVVYVELIGSALYIESEKDAYQYTLAFNDLRTKALDSDDSIAFIKQAITSV